MAVRSARYPLLKAPVSKEAAELAVKAAESKVPMVPQHSFNGVVEHAIAHIEEAFLNDVAEEQQRWYAIKIFERDEKVIEQLGMSEQVKTHIEKDICAAEKKWTTTRRVSSQTRDTFT